MPVTFWDQTPVEIRYQITRDDGSGIGAWGALLADDAVGINNFIISKFAADSVMSDIGPISGSEKDYTDGFHVVRWAQPAGGTDDMHLWVDGQLVTSTHFDNYNDGYNRIRVGVIFTGQSGSAVVDYVRIDNTGGFAPEAQTFTPGDFNMDGAVDVSDLGILATNYGITSGMGWGDGDANGDGAVDVSDLGILATNYGTTTSMVAGAVPEPAGLILLLGAMLLLVPSRLRRR